MCRINATDIMDETWKEKRTKSKALVEDTTERRQTPIRY